MAKYLSALPRVHRDCSRRAETPVPAVNGGIGIYSHNRSCVTSCFRGRSTDRVSATVVDEREVVMLTVPDKYVEQSRRDGCSCESNSILHRGERLHNCLPITQ